MPSFNAINLDMSKFIKGFKEFAVKGNAIDMAVGVIIGAAFRKDSFIDSFGYNNASYRMAYWRDGFCGSQGEAACQSHKP